jgi:hypothetical protein
MSSEISNFVTSLLASPPSAPHSVQLEVDTDGDVCALFEVLLLTMTDMLKRWYEPPITIGRISDEKHALLIDYFASFGIRFQMETCDNPSVLRINNREYLQQSRLEQMKFQISYENTLSTVRFSNLPTA